MKTLFCFLLLAASLMVSAQPDGKYLLNINGGITANEGYFESAIELRGAVFNKPRNIGGGLSIGYAHTKEPSVVTKGFEVAPFFRSYLLKRKFFGLFLGAGIGYGFYESEGYSVINYSAVNFGPDLGFSFFATPKAAIELELGMRRRTFIDDEGGTTYSFSRLGFTLFL